MRVLINKILDVPTSDPDDARRRRLLNILLLGIFVVAIQETDSPREAVVLSATHVAVYVVVLVVEPPELEVNSP